MVERLTITKLGRRGDGVAETQAGPAFVPYTLPGETVVAEPVAGHADRFTLLKVQTASPERVNPVCPHFGVCGGCALQHWDLSRQHEWKRQLVIDALASESLSAPVAPTIDAHGEGRRRATLHARRATHDIVEVGYMAPRGHQIVAIDRCPILATTMSGTIETSWDIANALKLTQKPLDIAVTATSVGLDIDVRGSGALNSAQTAALAKIAAARRLTRLSRHGELVAQHSTPVIAVDSLKVAIPPSTFLQATAAGEDALARLVVSYVGSAKTVVADLFCGIGPFALRLAQRARVSAFDSDAPAVEALRRAAAAAQGLKPIEAKARDLFRNPLVAPELKPFAAVVFDPPRQGAEAQSRELAKSKVPVIVAVSCDVTTFARDARILTEGSYSLTAVTPVDQFRYSPHVEIVARFER